MAGEDLRKPVWTQLEERVRDVPGWSPIDQLFALYTLVVATEVEGDLLELGSWCGRSAAVLGLAAQRAGVGRVICVDLFPEKDDWYRNADGSWSFRVQLEGGAVSAYTEQTVWAEPYARDIAPLYERHGGVLELFRRTMREHGLEGIVTPFKGDLAHFARQAPPGFRCKLAFIDGDHGYDAVCADIEQVERFLVPGGWICFDDAFSTYDGVDRAIEDRILASGRYDRAQQLTRKCFAARRRPEVQVRP